MTSEYEYVSKYIKYTDSILTEILNKYGYLEDSIAIKQDHGLIMKELVKNITDSSNMLNSTYLNTAKVEGLFHDIGRFNQYLLAGTLNDKESKLFTGFDDHGKYGRYLLEKNNKKLLKYFIGDNPNYDNMFLSIIGEHTKITNPNFLIAIENLENIFTNYAFDEVINSKDENIKNKLLALKLKILIEADSLEIFDKIAKGLWKPNISNNEEEFANDEIWNKFINFEYIDMKYFKEKGIWTSNAGFLLRYGLLCRNFNLVGTLINLKNENLLEKIWNQTEINSISTNGTQVQDPKLIFAQEYIKKALEYLIEFSDGKIITDDVRNKAKEKTKYYFELP